MDNHEEENEALAQSRAEGANSMVGLEACPFCGGEAAYAWIEYSERHVKEQGWKQRIFDFVSCVSCGVSNKGLVGFKTKEQAAKHWNTRAANV
ncbi:MAG: Lar family restriction alleviation protein [Candidatus Ferrigenium altingense]